MPGVPTPDDLITPRPHLSQCFCENHFAFASSMVCRKYSKCVRGKRNAVASMHWSETTSKRSARRDERDAPSLLRGSFDHQPQRSARQAFCAHWAVAELCGLRVSLISMPDRRRPASCIENRTSRYGQQRSHLRKLTELLCAGFEAVVPLFADDDAGSRGESGKQRHSMTPLFSWI